jgi:acyl carrier protein
MNDSTEERVIKIVAEVFKMPAEKISRETKFTDDLHAKSIDVAALLAALGGEFGMSVSAQEVQSNQTVGQAIDYIEEKLKK